MTQNDEILIDLQRGDRITQMDALMHYGCMRLASRINDLRKKGYPIKTNMKTINCRNGKIANVAEYSMEQ